MGAGFLSAGAQPGVVWAEYSNNVAKLAPLFVHIPAEFSSKMEQTCYDCSTLAFISPVFQVIAMEILYVTTMAAIFVLCLALLVTARRILRSSPLTNGDLSIAGMYGTQMPAGILDEDEETESPSFEDAVRARMDSVVSRQAEQEHVSTESVLANWVTAPLATNVGMSERDTHWEDARHEYRVEERDVATAVLDDYETEPAMRAMTDAEIEAPIQASAMKHSEPEAAKETVSNKPRKEKQSRERKPLPASYKYGLECLLLGVSVLALVASQRGAFRNKSVDTSRHRVA